MKTLTRFISEAKNKPAVFSFGRFNPPTTGHAKLVDRLSRIAKQVNGDPMVFTSHSVDKKKNPLTHKQCVWYLRKFFGKKVGIPDVAARTIFDICGALYEQGYKRIVMVVGSDRVREFDALIKKYNKRRGRHGFYDFDDIKIVSAGERDPDADDVSGMSASKMRAAAERGDFDAFKDGVADKKAAEKLYKDVRKGMGIMEGNLPEYMIEDLIQEGVYDPGIFKAVFLMGGPGSGKSTVVKKLALKSLGLKTINTDNQFEKGLIKAGQTLDLKIVPADIRDPIRKKAKRLTARGLDMYLDNRLGLIFDTTSADASKIRMYKKRLDILGYESKMVYVSATLANAQKRNSSRARKLPPEIVQSDWASSQQNIKTMKSIFKKDFVAITNDDDITSLDKKANSLHAKLMTWSSSFPNNSSASIWKQRQLLTKKYK
jgi:predicted kinase